MDENQILDSNETKEDRGNSKLSFYNLCVTTFIFLGFTLLALSQRYSWNVESKRELIELVLSVAFLISVISGFGLSISSMRRRERKTILEKIGIVGNLVFFLLTILMFVSMIRDISKFIM